MYAITTYLSIQNLFFKPSVCNSFSNKHATFTDKTAAVNFSIAIDINFFGEALDFANLTCIM